MLAPPPAAADGAASAGGGTWQCAAGLTAGEAAGNAAQLAGMDESMQALREVVVWPIKYAKEAAALGLKPDSLCLLPFLPRAFPAAALSPAAVSIWCAAAVWPSQYTHSLSLWRLKNRPTPHTFPSSPPTFHVQWPSVAIRCAAVWSARHRQDANGEGDSSGVQRTALHRHVNHHPSSEHTQEGSARAMLEACTNTRPFPSCPTPPHCIRSPSIFGAYAGESDRSSSIFGAYAGESERRLRDVFDAARGGKDGEGGLGEGVTEGGSEGGADLRPSIVFIDEIDVLCPKRDSSPNALDTALRRPGRFDREIAINVPGTREREAILKLHARSLPLHADVDMRQLAARCKGYVGADLAAVCREAALAAVMEMAAGEEERGGEAFSGGGGEVVGEGEAVLGKKEAALAALMEMAAGEEESVPGVGEVLFGRREALSGEGEVVSAALSRVGPSVTRGVAAELPAITWNDIGGLEGVKVRAYVKGKLLYVPQTAVLSRVGLSVTRGVAAELPAVLWNDIGGLEGVKKRLQMAVEWPLQHPEAFLRLALTPPRGVLLHGPPGGGKTMLALAAAHASKATLFSLRWVRALLPQVRALLPQVRALLPQVRALLPQVRALLPQVRALLPQVRALLPQVRALLPQVRALLPQVRALLPQVRSLLPQVRALLPQVRALLPQVRSLLPQVRALLPQVRALLLSLLSTLLPFESTQGDSPSLSPQRDLFSIGADLFSMYVGEGEAMLKETFRLARMAAPSVVFVDEVDVVGGRRSDAESSGEGGGGGSVGERLLAALLTEMDGLQSLTAPIAHSSTASSTSSSTDSSSISSTGSTNQGKSNDASAPSSSSSAVLVIAATNRFQALDPAIIRPGRFDSIIYVPPLDEAGRLHALHTHTPYPSPSP
ncbi:unnamed protein product [Closterium sp. NIES-64]|nr:unnamed protein product [Closterium sp. NIES-64]